MAYGPFKEPIIQPSRLQDELLFSFLRVGARFDYFTVQRASGQLLHLEVSLAVDKVVSSRALVLLAFVGLWNFLLIRSNDICLGYRLLFHYCSRDDLLDNHASPARALESS